MPDPEPETSVVDEALHETERSPARFPRLAGGKQKSLRLTGRISRYVADRRARHEVSEAEVVRAMLNEKIDDEELRERALRDAIAARVLADGV